MVYIINYAYYTEWSLSSLFKKSVKGTCPLASKTRISISSESSGLEFSVEPLPLRLSDNGWFTYHAADIAGEE